MYMVRLSLRTSPYLTSLHFTSLPNKITVHKSRQFTPHHFTSLIYTLSSLELPLLVNTFLILYLKVSSLQGKDACKPSGNWFQLLMVLFKKEYLPPSILCFLVLFFRL